MSGTTVVMVLDRDDPNRGSITILSTPQEAARVAEDLLEAGTALERIRLFDATERSLKAEHKTVVSLVANFEYEPVPTSQESPEHPTPESEPHPRLISAA